MITSAYKSDIIAFQEEIHTESNDTGFTETKIYADKVTSKLNEHSYIVVDYNPAYHKLFENCSISGYFDFYNLENKLTIVVTEYKTYLDEDNKTVLDGIFFNKVISAISEFVSSAFEFSNKNLDVLREVGDLKKYLHKFYKNNELNTVEILFLTNRNINMNRDDPFPEVFLPGLGSSKITINFDVWDIDRFFEYTKSHGKSEDIIIAFNELNDGKGLQLLQASSDKNDNLESYLCVVPGKFLAEIYNSHKSKLLEGNVRVFLSDKGKINKGIKETIYKEPTKFFAYNNGISTVCERADIEGGDEIRYLKKATNLQIINGGQTTASLGEALKKKQNLDDIYVQMKLTVIKLQEQDTNNEYSTIIGKIATTSNSQNAVRITDLSSNHLFHQNLEKVSVAPKAKNRKDGTYWFYERTRGLFAFKQSEYKDGPKAFLKVYPKKQVVQQTDISKTYMLWREMPHIVSKGAQTCFTKFKESVEDIKEWKKEDTCIEFYKNQVSILIMYKFIEKNCGLKSYRAQTINYTISLFKKLLSDNYPGKVFNLSAIWDNQSVPSNIGGLLLDMADTVYKKLTESSSTYNVTQWSKKEACWQAMQNLGFTLDDFLEEYIIDAPVVEQTSSDEQSDEDNDYDDVDPTYDETEESNAVEGSDTVSNNSNTYI